MQSQQGSEVSRRRLFAAGTGVFSSKEIDDLKEVPDEITAIQRLFQGLGFDLEPKANDLDHANLLTRCSDFRNSAAPGDVLVAYYTSHGVRDRERFYLLTSNSDLNDLDGTAVAAEDLARRLIKKAKARQVLIILDMCYAGAGLADIAKLASALAFTAGDSDPELYVIAAAGIKQTAKQSAFTNALTAVLRNVDERIAGKAQPFLQVGSLVAEINARLEKDGRQRARWSCLHSLGECLALPNPNYRNNIRPGLDLETQNAYEEHWIPKVRSAEMGVAGWYFTGRKVLLRKLINWLDQPSSDCKARIVTGSAGTGKSALLARIVTLSDPRLRGEILGSGSPGYSFDIIPPKEVVNAALVVRRKLLDDVVLDLANQLTLEATDASELREAIAKIGKKTVLVIDALDEADERQAIVDQLLRPLVEQPHVFLLLGTRPDPQTYNAQKGYQVNAFAAVSIELDLDDPTYGEPEDVAEYLCRRLLATEEPGRVTPYQKSPQQTEIIAKVLAKRCDHSFLVARTVVTTLLSRTEALDATLQDWENELPSGFEEALEQFLQELDGSLLNGISRSNARAVLQALAFAEGEGLPWDHIWASLASAISKTPISDDQIRKVRKLAAPFIVEALENGRSVYRLFHEKAAEVLRNRINQRDAHALIVRALQEQVIWSSDLTYLDWPQAHPYILSHLPAHAFKAGLLDEFTADQLFLAACEPSRLQTVINFLPTNLITAVYTTAYFNLINQSIEQRLAYLELAARQLGANVLADSWQNRELNRLWKVRWASWRTPTPHRKIILEAKAAGIALGYINDRRVILSASIEASNIVHIKAWDLATAHSVGSPINWFSQYDYITAVGTGTLTSRPVLICAGFIETGECIISVWDLVTGKEACLAIGISNISRDDEKSWVKSLSISSLGDRAVVIICNQNIYTWDPLTNSLIWPPVKCVCVDALGKLEWHSDSHVKAIALASVDNKSVIVYGGTDACIKVWDLESRQLCYMPLLGHKSTINDIAIVSLKEQVLMITASNDGTIRKWNLGNGQPVGDPLEGHKGFVNALAIAVQDGRYIIISGSDDSTIRIWDLENGHAIGSPLHGHNGDVNSIAVEKLGNESFIISGSNDKTIRIWHINSGRIFDAAPNGHDGSINTLAIERVYGKPVVITGGDDKALLIWDLYTGEAIGSHLVGHTEYIRKVVTASQNVKPVAISADSESIVLWDLTSRSLEHGKVCGTASFSAVTIGYVDGLPLVIAGSADGTIRVLKIASEGADSETSLLIPLQSFDTVRYMKKMRKTDVIFSGSQFGRVWNPGGISALALGSLNGQYIVISGSDNGCISVWKLSNGELLLTSSGIHRYEVVSITAGSLAGSPAFVSGSDDGTIRAWTLDDLWTLGDLESDRLFVAESILNRELLSLKEHLESAVCREELAIAASISDRMRNLCRHIHAQLGGLESIYEASSGCVCRLKDERIISFASGCIGGHHVVISASESVCEAAIHPLQAMHDIDNLSGSTIRIWDLSNKKPWQPMPFPIRIGTRVNAVEIIDNSLVVCGDDGLLMIEIPIDQENQV